MQLSRQEYWSGLPVPTPGDPFDLEIQPMSPVSSVLPGRFFTTEPPEKPHFILWVYHNMFNGSLTDGHLAFSQYFIKNTTMNKFLSQSICAFIVFIGAVKFSSTQVALG